MMAVDLIQRIKIILSIDAEDTSADELLELLCDKCESYVRGYCGVRGNAPLGEQLVNAVQDLAVGRYNKLGSEGLEKEVIGPMTLEYSDIPGDVLQILNRYKKVSF